MISATPSPFRVLKFGGAALADGPQVRRAAEIVERFGGERPVLIVSAVRGVTSLLEELARGASESRLLRLRHRSLLRELELSSELLDPFLRELESLLVLLRETPDPGRSHLDHLLSLGERMSARVVAAHLRSRGQEATAVDAHDLGLVTEAEGDEVRLLPDSDARIRAAIDEVEGIPVVTGFLAADRRGNLTTLGRNGSDLSAIFVARAIAASEIQLWKCVAGIQTADPNLVPEACSIPELSFDEAIELSRLGARVLHHGAAVAAREAGIPVVLRDVREPGAPGTRLVANPSRTAAPILVNREHRVALVYRRTAEAAAGVERVEEFLRERGIRTSSERLRPDRCLLTWCFDHARLGADLREVHGVLFEAASRAGASERVVI